MGFKRYPKRGVRMKYELPSTELIVIEESNYLKFGEYLNDMQCDDTVNKLSLDNLEYVKKLQQENARLKDKIDMINKLLNEPIFEYDNIPYNIENEIIQLKDILKEN